MKPRRIVLKILLALGLLLLFTAFAGFFFPQQVLTVDSGPVTGDVLVVLGGTPDRPQRAAELFQAGEAPRIICSGIGDALANEAWLTNAGVPVSAISLEPQSHTTRENAKFSIALLRSLGAQRVIIVTTWYHSRRALACFEHYAPDIKFYSRPSYFGYPGQTKAEMLKGEKTPPPIKATSSDLRPPSPQRGEGNLPGRGGEGVATNLSLSASQLSAFRARQRAEWQAVRGYMKAEYEKLLGYWVCYGICPI